MDKDGDLLDPNEISGREAPKNIFDEYIDNLNFECEKARKLEEAEQESKTGLETEEDLDNITDAIFPDSNFDQYRKEIIRYVPSADISKEIDDNPWIQPISTSSELAFPQPSDRDSLEILRRQQSLCNGKWLFNDENGIHTLNDKGKLVIACMFPIIISKRYIDIETDENQLEIAFFLRNDLKKVIMNRVLVGSNTVVKALANVGAHVTKATASNLVQYFHDYERVYENRIQTKYSSRRLGWVRNGDFVPYSERTVLDPTSTFGRLADSIKESGSRESWYDGIKDIRKGSIPGRIALAASFSSVLVQILDKLGFFVHIWGLTGTGKTIALEVAASVWGDPRVGRYIQTFSSTRIGQERYIAFLHDLPYLIDELQLSMTDQAKKYDNLIYALTEGSSGVKAEGSFGIKEILTWSNCILTNGESSILPQQSDDGALSRTIEVELVTKVFQDNAAIRELVNSNYGYAGRDFVAKLQESGNKERAQAIYKQKYLELSGYGINDKQAMSMSIILTADTLIEEWLFQDGQAIQNEEVIEFLHQTPAISEDTLGYTRIITWVNENMTHFNGSLGADDSWGVIENGLVYIIRSHFNRIAGEFGYKHVRLIRVLKEKQLILFRGKNNTLGKVICGNNLECVVLKLNGSVTANDSTHPSDG